jgi:flagellar hook-length control protein FliK
MSRLNLDSLTGFVRTDLTSGSSGLLSVDRGRARVFDTHLDQATRAAAPPPRDDSRSPAEAERPRASQPRDRKAPEAPERDPSRDGPDQAARGEEEPEEQPADTTAETAGDKSPGQATDAAEAEADSDREQREDHDNDEDRQEAAEEGQTVNSTPESSTQGALTAAKTEGDQAIAALLAKQATQESPQPGGNAIGGGQAPEQPAQPGAASAQAAEDGAQTGAESIGQEAPAAGDAGHEGDGRLRPGSVPQVEASEASARQTAAVASAGSAVAVEQETGPVQTEATEANRRQHGEASKSPTKNDLTAQLAAVTIATEPVAETTPGSATLKVDAVVQDDSASLAAATVLPAEPAETEETARTTTSSSTTTAAPESGTVSRSASSPVAYRAGDASGQDTSSSGAVERARFVQRVARAFQAVGDGGGSIRLRLRPPDLGSLHLEITVRNGAMNARMEVESSAARNALLDNLPALRERLAQQDIRIERFDIDMTEDFTGGLPQQPGNDSQSGQYGTPWNSSSREHTVVTDSPVATPAAVRPGEGSQLNVVI